MERKNQRISDLFYNNRFLLVFSVVAAIALWLVVAVEYGPEVTETITVPITANFSNFENQGLSAFGYDNSDTKKYSVDVTVKGSRVIVNSDDMVDKVSANLQLSSSGITGPNTYEFEIVVSKKDNNDSSFEIISHNAQEINYDENGLNRYKYYFDNKVQNAEKVVEPMIDFNKSYNADEYYILEEDKWSFSPNVNRKITVSGPKTYVDKIDRVVAKNSVNDKINKSLSVQAEIQLLDKDGNNLLANSENYLTVSHKEVTIEIPVYSVRKLNAHYSCANIPAKFIKEQKNPFTVKFEPAVFSAAVPEASVNNTNFINVFTIDYSKLNSGENVFVVYTSEIENCIFLDGTEKITVTVNTVGMDSKTLPAPDLSKVKQNMDLDDKEITFLSINFDEVTMVGPKESLAKLDPEDLSITADLSSVPENYTGAANVPAIITTEDCWSFCDEQKDNYTVTVQIR